MSKHVDILTLKPESVMFDVDLVQALPISCHDPPSVQAVQGEAAGVISEVVKEAGQGTEQDGDHDRGVTPPVKVGEKMLIWGRGGLSGE